MGAVLKQTAGTAALCAVFAVGHGEIWAQAPEVELYLGPLVAPAKIVGMGGAYTSIALGSGAQLLNPAAVANRYPYSSHDFFDWDWDLDWLFTSEPGAGLDLENNGRETSPGERVGVLTGAIHLNLGRFGFGIALSSQTFHVPLPLSDGCRTSAQETCRVRYTSLRFAASGGYSLFEGSLLVGAQVSAPFTEIRRESPGLVQDQPPITRLEGGGFALGVVWRPEGLPYRLGASFLSSMHLRPEEARAPDASALGSLPLLERLSSPWQLALGASYSIGGLLNPRVSFGESGESGEPVWHGTSAERSTITVATDFVVIGPSDGAVGFESWISGVPQAAGRSTSVGFRAGIDSEFWPDQMRGRMGFYYEPSRFEETLGRTHATAGFDLRLIEVIWVWRFTAGIDLAKRYTNLMLSIGWWH